MTLTYRHLLARMATEEWRLHARLFGGARFALFPAFVAAVAAGAVTFLAFAAIDVEAMVLGLHVLVGLVGLQVGTVGLVGRDALEDLLGDTTLLIYSARTLPVSMERLLVAFLVKDVGYYTGLFVLPLVVGLVPLAVLGSLAPARIAIVAGTAIWTFALGVSASLALVGVYTRSRIAVLAVVGAFAVVGGLRSELLLRATPYRLSVGADPVAAAISTVAVLGLGVVGVALFRFDRRSPARTATNRFAELRGFLGGVDQQGALAKSLLDVHRSSGGVWKLAFSQGIVFVVLAVLLDAIPRVVPVRVQPGLAIGTILALGSFTTYNWLCQFEDEAFYLRYPVALPTVFRAKLIAFLVLALPVGLAYMALGALVFSAATALLGAVVFVPLSLFVFGVTAYVAGLRPNELLFDTPTFALFTGAMAVVLVPLVVAAIAYPTAPLAYGGGSLGLAAVAGLIGVVLARRAGPRWERRARAGS